MTDIGQVSAEEVNRVAAWLAELTRQHNLPQKLLVLHQFRLDMLPDREASWCRPSCSSSCRWTGSAPGDQGPDLGGVTMEPPAGTRFGWKNFFDEGAPCSAGRDRRPPADGGVHLLPVAPQTEHEVDRQTPTRNATFTASPERR